MAIPFALMLALALGADDAAPSRRIALDQAAALALREASSIALATERIKVQQGGLDQAGAVFESAWQARTVVGTVRGELLPAVLRQQQGNRFLFESLIDSTGSIADDLEAQLLLSGNLAEIECPNDTQIIIDGVDICEDAELINRRRNISDVLSALATTVVDPLQAFEAREIQNQLFAATRDAAAQIITQLRTVELSSTISRERQGDIPSVERKSNLTLELGLVMPQRSGLVITPALQIEGLDEVFEGRPRRADFGGKGTLPAFTSRVGVNLKVPLGRGQSAGITAPVDAATLSLEAEQESARHTRSVALRESIQAWLALAAAEAQLRLSARTAQAQVKLVEVTRALADADVVPVANLEQALAQQALVSASVYTAERTLRSARSRLARALNLQVSTPEQLYDAEGTLPELPAASCPLEAIRLRELALRQRSDLRNLDLSERASRRLIDEARDGLRARWDLSITAGYSGFDENLDVVDGVVQSLLKDPAGPSILFELDGELAMQNLAAQGRLMRSLALADQSQIQRIELERQISRRVLELVTTLELKRQALSLRREAAAASAQALDSSRDAFQSGELALLDLLSTELQADSALASLIEAQRDVLAAIVDLRFETATLLDPADQQSLDFASLFLYPCGA